MEEQKINNKPKISFMKNVLILMFSEVAVKVMADKGTSIIIVKSNSEYMEECSDRIIDLDEIYKEQ